MGGMALKRILRVSFWGPSPEAISHITLRHRLARIGHSYFYSTSLGSPLTWSSNTNDTILPSLSQAERNVGWTQQGPLCILSLEKLLADTQTDIELWGFGMGPVLSPSSCWLGQYHPQCKAVLICFTKSWWPYPAELSSVGKREHCSHLGPLEPVHGSRQHC